MLFDNYSIGCAGWSLPRMLRSPEPAHYLEQYSRFFDCVEINSSFYRDHKPETYKKWAATVPAQFRFCAKIPRAASHDTKLAQPELIDNFLLGMDNLGYKVGPILLQTPPKLEFNPRTVEKFFRYVRNRFDGAIVCEPRHESWLENAARSLLDSFGIPIVAADPGLRNPITTGFTGKGSEYIRLHGAPKIYYSEYSTEFLSALAGKIRSATAPKIWIIFDNTAHGYAFTDAEKLKTILKPTITVRGAPAAA